MAGFELIGKEEREEINDVFERGGGVLFRHSFEALRNGVYKVNDFEKEFAVKFGVAYTRAVTSGTAALLVALKALGVKPGDEVITQSFTFVATVEAILMAGAIPVIVDIDKSLNLDPKCLESKITVKTKAIIPVHMMGGAARMDEIMEIAKKHNLVVLEDAAQALGGKYKGKYLGTIGDAGIFSFDFGKALTTGEGGMVVTNNKDIYLRVKEYSDHGHESNPNFPRGQDTRKTWGFNFSMNELQGAVGLAQLRKIDFARSKQKENKYKIKNALKGIASIESRDLPDEDGTTPDNLVFFCEDKAKANLLVQSLGKEGIGTNILPGAFNWHFAGTWNHMLTNTQDWEKSKMILERTIALPIMIKMTDEQINKIIQIISNYEKM